MRFVEVRVEVQGRNGAKEEIWVLPLAHLTQVRWAESGAGKAVLHLYFDNGLALYAPDPDKALLDEIRMALETPNGVYAVGGLWGCEVD